MATIGDLVLVHVDNRPGFFARIEGITPDVKPAWWQVRLLVLTVPMQIYTWILDESQVNGAPFTMGGTPIMLEKVVPPEPREARQPHPSGDSSATAGADDPHSNVVFLKDRKKKE